MKTLSTTLLIASLLLVALPGRAAEGYRFIIDASSPRYIPTGIILEEAENIAISGRGVLSVASSVGFDQQAFGPSGLAGTTVSGQPVDVAPYGTLLASTDGTDHHVEAVGSLSTLVVTPEQAGNELFLAINLPSDQLDALQGLFEVGVFRYDPEEANREVARFSRDTPYIYETSFVVEEGDKLLMLARGNASLDGDDSWMWGNFGPTGLGFVRRDNQIKGSVPFGSLMATFASSMYFADYVGDLWTKTIYAGLNNNTVKLALNMSEEDHQHMHGEITAYLVHLHEVTQVSVHDGPVPAVDAIVSVGNHPNPFNPTTTVSFDLAREQRVRVSVLNLRGEVVKTLAQQRFSAGRHQLMWNGQDEQGRGQASGTYVLRLDTEGGSKSHKLSLVQ